MERRQGVHRIDSDQNPETLKRNTASQWASDPHFNQEPRADDGPPPEIRADGVVILIPVFNDWASLAQLLPRLDAALAPHFFTVDVLVVDDGSTAPVGDSELAGPFTSLSRIDVLRLRRNLGHQRAIAIGLAYIEDCLPADAVVVMDGDGEDNPADVPRLLERLEQAGSTTIVFAERARRSESVVFRVFYALFKLLHRVLTGNTVKVGNFSAIPRPRLSSLVVVDDIWNHYAAAALRSRQPYCMIPTHRSRRLRGNSTMNFVSLVTHGLSAISVYSDIVGVRLLVVSILLALTTLMGMVTAVIVRLTTNLAIPGWASYTVGILLILFIQAIMAAFVFSFAILGSRRGSTFLPRRDYSYFIGPIWTAYGPAQSRARSPINESKSQALVSGK